MTKKMTLALGASSLVLFGLASLQGCDVGETSPVPAAGAPAAGRACCWAVLRLPVLPVPALPVPALPVQAPAGQWQVARAGRLAQRGRLRVPADRARVPVDRARVPWIERGCQWIERGCRWIERGRRWIERGLGGQERRRRIERGLGGQEWRRRHCRRLNSARRTDRLNSEFSGAARAAAWVITTREVSGAQTAFGLRSRKRPRSRICDLALS